MKGRLCLVTGANSGIGFGTAVGLARAGADVVLLCRDQARGEEALAAVRKEARGGTAELLVCDLGSLASVRSGAAEFKKRHDRLHVLVNNAGVWTRERRTSADGYEQTFAVNHLGPFLLTNLLLDRLAAGAPSRIVNVSSGLHFRGTMDWDDLQMEKRFDGYAAYCNSKLANVLFTRALQKRLPKGVTANSLHPGVIATGLSRELPWAARAAMNLVLSGVEKGAEPSLRAATAPELEGRSGLYFDKLRETEPSAASRDDAAAERLWELSTAFANK